MVTVLLFLCIFKYVRLHSNNQSLVTKNKQKQDLLVIQRIFITFGVLSVVVTPTSVFVLLAYINHVEHPLTHRMTMLSYAMSMVVLSVETIFVTTQLKALLLKIWQRNRVILIGINLAGSIPNNVVNEIEV
jgi:hypothetical protein